jgi:hypothetical protein
MDLRKRGGRGAGGDVWPTPIPTPHAMPRPPPSTPTHPRMRPPPHAPHTHMQMDLLACSASLPQAEAGAQRQQHAHAHPAGGAGGGLASALLGRREATEEEEEGGVEWLDEWRDSPPGLRGGSCEPGGSRRWLDVCGRGGSSTSRRPGGSWTLGSRAGRLDDRRSSAPQVPGIGRPGQPTAHLRGRGRAGRPLSHTGLPPGPPTLATLRSGVISNPGLAAARAPTRMGGAASGLAAPHHQQHGAGRGGGPRAGPTAAQVAQARLDAIVRGVSLQLVESRREQQRRSAGTGGGPGAGAGVGSEPGSWPQVPAEPTHAQEEGGEGAQRPSQGAPPGGSSPASAWGRAPSCPGGLAGG